jgi:TP901 family phage tail tape measure protein
MERLLMQVALIDQVTRPLQGITRQMQTTADAGRQGMANMASGGAGLVASGLAIQAALMPAIEMDRQMGEVKSLGVADDALKQLQATALDFSAEYGKSATDFVAASYDIKSAFGDINGDQLSDITKSSAILAAATKADTGTITSYMGTMFGIFKNQAESMGVGEWSKQVAGMTAQSVEMFKTTGKGMSDAFTGVGANATAAGIDMNEQMAILGTLQATMSGRQAGTQYKAFLSGLANAQNKLGLEFTDSQGRMLPMIDILGKLKGQFGDTFDVAESDSLKKAFGSDEAVSMIKLLMADTDGLSNSINKLGDVTGMSKAETMAAAMTDQWERLEAVWFAVRAAVFGAILPSINAVVGSMADGMMVITGWVQEFPLLGEILGWVAIAGISLGGVVASVSLAMGIGQMMSAGWAFTMGTLGSVMKLLRLNTIAMTASTWLFNAALWANPITWVVAGIALLVGAVAAMIYWWDDLTAAFKDTAWFNVIASAVEGLIDLLNMIPGVDIQLGTTVADTPELKAANDIAVSTPEIKAAADIKQIVQPVSPLSATQVSGFAAVANDALPDVAAYKQPQNITAPPKAMVQNLTMNQKPQGNNVRQYGDVYITAPNGITPDQLAEWDELNAG